MPASAAQPRSLTVTDVSRQYGVAVHTVLHWINSGQLRALNVARRAGARKPRWRVTEAALVEFEAARAAAGPAPQAARRRRPIGVVEFYR